MRSLKLMDVTIRESIYVPEANLTEDHAVQLVHGLSSFDIDYIEIGYIQLEKNNYLPYFCPIEYINKLSNAIVPGSKSRLVVMLHPHQYAPSLLKHMHHVNVDMVRLCIPLTKVANVIPLITHLKSEGIKVSANLLRVSGATEKDILNFAMQLEQAGADIFYLADSNGALLPQQVNQLYSMLSKNLNIQLGFHPHNNLQLASANALEAFNAGASIVDGSIFGFGKGLSNLCLESFVAILERSEVFKNKNIGKLIETSEKAYQNFIHHSIKDIYLFGQKGILVGYHNINLDILERLEKKANESNISSLDLLLELHNQSLNQSIDVLLQKIC